MSRKKRYLQRQQKAANGPNPTYQAVVQMTPAGMPVMMPRNMKAYVGEGYRNKTAFRVVGQIARSAAGIKWKHYTDQNKEREISNSPLLKLWNKPNREDGGVTFRQKLLYSYCLTGNSYILGINATQNPTRPFDELYTLRPDLMRIEVNEGGPSKYEYGPSYPYKEYDPRFVQHDKLFAGNDDVYGLSPIEVAAFLIDIQKASQKWNLGLMSNSARPGGAWVTDAVLQNQEYLSLKREIREKFAGPRNAGETVILHGGVKWQSMGMTPMELDFLNTDTKGDRDIAGIFFNFPVYLLGLADATFANMAEAKHYLYTDIVFPILDMYEDSLNSWLTPRYGGWLGYDKEDVETIQERLQAAKAQASDRAAQEFTGGTTTFLEAREIQGKQLLPVKDFVIINQVPVHVDQLDEYIEAMAGKTINPPPPPPQLPLPGSTVVDALPNGDTADDTGDDNSDTGDKHLPVRHAPKLLPQSLRATKVLDLATTAQKQAYAKSMEERREKWYDTAQQRIADYFSSEQKTVLAALQRTDSTSDASDRVQHALATQEQAGTLTHILVTLYQDVGTDIGGEVMKELKSQGGHYARKDDIQNYLNLYGPDVLIYLLQLAGSKVTQINGTTLAQLQSELSDGVAAGESIPDLAKRIDNLYLQQIIPNRSTVISRTEVVSASNWSAVEAAKQSGLTLNKVWLATEDARTRPAHAAADGQVVALDVPFEVDGEQLMQPGDSSGSASNVIQCRCTVYFQRVRGEIQPVTDAEPEPVKRFSDITKEEYKRLLKMEVTL